MIDNRSRATPREFVAGLIPKRDLTLPNQDITAIPRREDALRKDVGEFEHALGGQGRNSHLFVFFSDATVNLQYSTHCTVRTVFKN